MTPMHSGQWAETVLYGFTGGVDGGWPGASSVPADPGSPRWYSFSIQDETVAGTGRVGIGADDDFMQIDEVGIGMGRARNICHIRASVRTVMARAE